MSIYLYMLIPYMSIGILALSIKFKIYNRSVATFMSFVSIAVTSNCFYYGYIEIGIIATVVYIGIAMARAICKPSTNKSSGMYCSVLKCVKRKCL